MPIYEYRCAANGRLVEVQHKMAEKLQTWGELCARAGVSPGTTNPKAPVEKLLSAGFLPSSAAQPACESPTCGMGPCATGRCEA